MKPKIAKIDIFAIIALTVLILGVISSFLDLGLISVFFSVSLPLIFILNCIFAIYGIFKKKYVYLAGVIIFLLCYNFFFQFSSSNVSGIKDSVSILSYNVRLFKQPIPSSPKQSAAAEIIKFVDSLNPDILLLQESISIEDRKIKGYPYHFMGYRKNIEKSPLTIHSKYPIIDRGYIDFPNTKNNAIYVDLKIKEDTIRIYNAHLQSFFISPHIIANKYKDYDYLSRLNNTITKQIEQAKLIKNHADKSNKKIIISGDFNATPYSKPYRILREGLNDSFTIKGNGFGETYSRFNYPLRLDYFLPDKQIEIVSHKNFDLNLSDHEPIFMNFKIK